MTKLNALNEKYVLESIFLGKIINTFEGNSGRVYLVENTPIPPATYTIPKFIAYKKCKRYDGDSFEIFKEETEKWFQIVSRYVLPIQYIDIIEGQYFVCMRAGIDGNLSELILNGLDDVAAYNIALQLVKGLIDMQASGIKHHQDLNPPNIMFEDMSKLFDSNGKPVNDRTEYEPYPPQEYHYSFKYRVMISDFGMANYFLKDPVQGKAGGKFAYKAPEQYDKSIDGFAPDLFALGVILCMMFTGMHPTGEDAAFALKKSPKLKQGWSSWAKNGERLVNCANQKVTKLILSLLEPMPNDRPSLQHVFDTLLAEFETLDKGQSINARFLFKFFEETYIKDKKSILEVRNHTI
ncbi:TPA: protein kinase [Vibrio harveyi]|nr:protein kinase [Vibrio harveyi]